MGILNPWIFNSRQGAAVRFVALATKASTQRSIG
jgi:hypothetical protein